MANTLILVDYDNVFVTLKNNYRDFKKPNIMYDVITQISEYYSNDTILSFKLFADFQKVQISSDGYDILKRNHIEIEHVFNGKNASDVILMIHCMKYMMQYPHIDQIVLVSSDSDLVPIFHEIKLLNKRLEVLYFDINTGENHKQHMREANIKHHSLEHLLELEPYQECPDIESFYSYKTGDTGYFTEILQRINDIIRAEYNKFLQYDDFGRIENIGFIRLTELIEQMRGQAICPEREFLKNTDRCYMNIIALLQEKSILVKHDYTLKGRLYHTLLLSEQYLYNHGIIINNLVNKSNYPN